MEIKYCRNAADFLAFTGNYLAEDEARYGMVLGLAKALEQNPDVFPKGDPWLCAISTGKNINAAGIKTPLSPVFLAHLSEDKQAVAKSLVKAVSKSFSDIPAVAGEKEPTDIFAKLWCKKRKTTILSTMEQRLYRLDKVNDVPLSPGKLRQATMADKELVVKWSHAFSADVESGGTMNTPEPDVTPRIEFGWVYFWEDDDQPVSMVMKGRATENGMTVNHVYTPPELRGRGYATSCVAELSRQILKSGKKFCVLYTDLANAASNSIYVKIGYTPVCDSVWYAFKTPKA